VTVRRTRRTPGPTIDLRGDAESGDVPSHVHGPSVIALPGATLVVPAGWSGGPDETGTIILERVEERS
jgi:hypothetical protein